MNLIHLSEEASMRMDLLGLEAFLAIAEFRSFRRAASQLNLSQTAVSHRLRKLEASLGVQLFTRTSRAVLLTPEGTELLPRARELIDALSDHVEQVRRRGREQEISLSFACLPTVASHIVPWALSAFCRRRPEVIVRVFDVSANEIGPLVASGAVEFGLTIVATSHQDLAAEPILTERYVLVCPSGHPFGRRRSVVWADLKGQPLIRVNQQTANRMIVDQALGSRSEGLSWRFEVQHTATAFRLVRQGLGLTVTPHLAYEVLADHDVCAVTLLRPKVTRTIGILSPRGIPCTAMTREFQDCLRAELTRIGK
jgi:DNA-binding transcriptional LysR family regulator